MKPTETLAHELVGDIEEEGNGHLRCRGDKHGYRCMRAAEAIEARDAEALETAARAVEEMVVVGRAWTAEQEIAADALFEAARRIRALASPESTK